MSLKFNPFTGTFDFDKAGAGISDAPSDGTTYGRNNAAWVAITGGGDMLSSANLSDLANAATARTNLGVDAAGTDNSTDVTLAGTGTYLSLTGQQITVDPITESDISDLQAYITGITGEPLSDLSDVTIDTIASGELLKWNGTGWVNNTLAEAGIAAASHNHAAGDITSGTLADARVAQSNVTQHQAALSITESQISDLDHDIAAASTTVAGKVELATIAETDTGTDALRAITPAGLAGSALQTKVDGIEAGADVTDTSNVTAAGALMDSEVDADIKTLSLPANTTISTFGASLIDDASASAARTTLGVDAAGTDNSTDVTLAGTGTYISIVGQVITVDPITESDISDLGSYLTDAPSNGSTYGRKDGAWAVIPGGGDLLSTNNLSDLANAATARTNLGVDPAGTDNSTDVTLTGTPDYITITGQVITRNPIDLTADVTGTLPDANVANDITLDNITQITSRSHTALTDIGTYSHDNLDNFMDFFNGTFQESFNALVTSDGVTITMSIEQSGGGDLTTRFSSGLGTLDCTPAATIALTAGSDTSPQENFIYVLESTGALTKSTTDWPSAEHIKVAYFLVPSAGFVQTNGVYINQNWNDHAAGTDNMGHMAHMAERSRRDGAYYYSGIDGNGTDGYLTPTASNVELKSTAGVLYQMHKHTVPAFDTSTTGTVLVKNWNGDAYHDITNLYDITADSTGASIGTNKWFNLVIWGVANKGGEYAPMMINLPSGSYANQADAEADVSGYDDFSIPAAFTNESSTGFLIARVTVQKKTTWVVGSTTDLRGLTPLTASGGVTGAVTEFADNTFTIFDESDTTKVAQFQASGITTATTRILTIPDASGTIELEGHTHTESEISDLDHYTNTDADTWLATKTTDNLTEGASNLYFSAAEQSKLAGIEASADVTDTTNVTAAGALMDSEVDADIKTLSLPANTTISAFGASLIDDASASAARTTLGVDAAGTDNSTDVTLAGTGTYISIAGQVITVDPITESDITDLGSYITDISGSPLSELSDVTITTIASGELLKWDGAAWINNTLAEAGISATGHGHTASDVSDFDTEVSNNASVAANTAKVGVTTEISDITGEPLSDLSDVTITTIASGELLKWNGTAWINNTLAEAGISATGHGHTESDISDLGTTVAMVADNLSVFGNTTSAQLAGIMTDETGSGALVFGTSPTIVTPTIASFTNATHDHEDAAGGGQLGVDAVATGVLGDVDGATRTTTSTSATTLTGAPSVTVTIPASGKVLVMYSAISWNTTSAAYTYHRIDYSGTTNNGNTRTMFQRQQIGSGTALVQSGAITQLMTGLTAGESTTFTAKNWVSGGTGTFDERSLVVLPIA